MKKTFALLLIICCSFSINGQSKKEDFPEFILPKGLPKDSIASYLSKANFKIVSKATNETINYKYAKAFFDDMNYDGSKFYTIDSIPEVSRLIMNGIEFQSKKVLIKIANFKIKNINKDSSFTIGSVSRDSVTGSLTYRDIKREYQRPYARATQEHPILAHDFFLFKINTLEPVRYRCSSYSPILDVFNTEDSIGFLLKPRVMICCKPLLFFPPQPP